MAEGGAERWASFLAQQLEPTDFDVSLLLLRDKIDYHIPSTVTVECVDHHSSRHTWRTVSRLRSFLNRKQTSVVISNGNYTSQFAGQTVGKMRCRWIARFSGNSAMGTQTLSQHVGWWWLDRNISKANFLVANSEGVRDDIATRWPKFRSRLRMIRNGVALSHFSPRERSPLADENLIVGVGRLSEPKRPDIFVNVIAQLAAEVKKARHTKASGGWQAKPLRAVWCGDGPLRSEIERQIDQYGLHENVKLLGFRHDVQHWIEKASCFVLTSDHEGSPNVLAEAMAIGTPIISTDCSFGPSELLGDDRGRLAVVGDEQSLVDAIKDTLQNPDGAHYRAEKAKQWASQHLSANTIREQWVSLIRETLLES